jgi:plasmid rolling circle replication initiator protein Rep
MPGRSKALSEGRRAMFEGMFFAETLVEDKADNFEPPHDLLDAEFDQSKFRARRQLADRVADAMFALGENFNGRASRIRDCGKLLEFNCYSVPDTFEIIRVPVNGSYCRERLCPMCMWRHSRWLHVQLCKLVSAYLAAKPDHQALLLTLTVKNVSPDKLRQAIDELLKGFYKLSRYKRFANAVDAWWRVTEITRNADTGEMHPHLHIILMVPPAYFRRSAKLYIPQSEWVSKFRRAIKADYDPICDIRPLQGVGGGAPLDEEGRKSLFEACKYVCEPGMFLDVDLADFPLREIHDAVHGRRLIGMSVSLRNLSDELSLDEDVPDDFEPENRLPQGAMLIGRETYQWQRGQEHDNSRYVLLRFCEWQPAQQKEADMTDVKPG